jgi:hypothetical protein
MMLFQSLLSYQNFNFYVILIGFDIDIVYLHRYIYLHSWFVRFVLGGGPSQPHYAHYFLVTLASKPFSSVSVHPALPGFGRLSGPFHPAITACYLLLISNVPVVGSSAQVLHSPLIYSRLAGASLDPSKNPHSHLNIPYPLLFFCSHLKCGHFCLFLYSEQDSIIVISLSLHG